MFGQKKTAEFQNPESKHELCPYSHPPASVLTHRLCDTLLKLPTAAAITVMKRERSVCVCECASAKLRLHISVQMCPSS